MENKDTYRRKIEGLLTEWEDKIDGLLTKADAATASARSHYHEHLQTLWLFGPVWMLAGAVVLVVVLAKIDRPV